MHLHRRTINWDVHSESHLSWGTHYQNLSRPDPIMASERYIALASNTYITYQGSAFREFDFLNWISLDLLSALLFLFCSIFPISSYFRPTGFLGISPAIQRRQRDTWNIFSYHADHLSSVLQISFKEYADIFSTIFWFLEVLKYFLMSWCWVSVERLWVIGSCWVIINSINIFVGCKIICNWSFKSKLRQRYI